MALRQTTGSVVCPSCGYLVGVTDETCYNCGRRNPGMWGFAPLLRSLGRDMGFAPLVMGGCAVLYVVSLLLSGRYINMQGMFGFLGPSGEAMLLLGASGWIPVVEFGRWWTPLSAGWLHAGLLHIAFNMLWVRDLAPVVAEIYGAGRAAVIYTVASVTGFVLSTLAPKLAEIVPPLALLGGGGLTVGASAPIFGLLGALVGYGRMGGSPHVTSQAKTYALMMFVFGFLMRGVDNWAHAGGFIGGYVMARLLNPFKPERLDHLIWGMLCLLATALAIIASIIDGLPLYGALMQMR